MLAGPLYARFEVEPGEPLPDGEVERATEGRPQNADRLAMGGGGFEPPKAEPLDLQSNPFDHSGIPPGMPAGDFSGGFANDLDAGST